MTGVLHGSEGEGGRGEEKDSTGEEDRTEEERHRRMKGGGVKEKTSRQDWGG